MAETAAAARLPRFAVLIDADNAPARIVDGLFEEIATFGEAIVRRIYGDFSGPRLKPWVEVLARHAIQPCPQFANTTGKNASDIALVIDAMDLLHGGGLDGFCLVSSDSDFTRLASRLREKGADVYGFGERKTPESFRQACRRFIYTENLLPEPPGGTAAAAAAPGGEADPVPAAPPRLPASRAVPLLRKAIEQMETEDGWAVLGTVGQHLAQIASDFDTRTYGCRTLSDLVRRTGAFDLDDSRRPVLRIRVRPPGAPKAKAAAAPRPPG